MPFPENEQECLTINYLITEMLVNDVHENRLEYKPTVMMLENTNFDATNTKIETDSIQTMTTITDTSNHGNPELTKKLNGSLDFYQQKICDDIEQEQQERSRAVALGKTKGHLKKDGKKSSGSKGNKKSKDSGKSKGSVKPIFDDAFTKKKEAKFDVNEAFDKLKTTTSQKYRNVIKLLHEINKLELAHEASLSSSDPRKVNVTKKGSHMNFHDPLGVLTIVRTHGRDDFFKPHVINDMILRRLQGISGVDHIKE